MNQSIFLNNVVDLVNEIATFLHNFLLFLTPDPSKQLTICVFAGLTRNPTAPPDHLKLLHQSAQQKGTFSLSSFTPFFNAVLTIGSLEVFTNCKRVILSITIFNLLTN